MISAKLLKFNRSYLFLEKERLKFNRVIFLEKERLKYFARFTPLNQNIILILFCYPIVEF